MNKVANKSAAGLLRASEALNAAADWLYAASKGRTHIGKYQVWTEAALHQFAATHHARGRAGFEPPLSRAEFDALPEPNAPQQATPSLRLVTSL